MIKPPSHFRPFDAFFSGDPALIPLPDEATEEQIAERDRRLNIALESGRWDDVVVAGQTPTRFRLRPLSSEEYGEITSMLVNREPPFGAWKLAFQLALLDAAPLPDNVKVGFATTASGKKVATTAFLDEAGCGGELGAEIIVELGQLVFNRSKAMPPKS